MLKAADMMTESVVTVDPNDTVDRAVSLMVRYAISGLPVVDQLGQLVGIISEFDLLELLSDCQAGKEKVCDYMSTELRTVTEETDCREVVRILRSTRLKRLPVTQNGTLVGIISRHDLIRSIQKERRPPEQASTKTQPQEVRLDCRVLVAEDGHANARFLLLALKKAGAEVELAEDGQVAVDKVLKTTSVRGHEGQAKPFDIILMDMQMPVLDGYDATIRLRQQGYRGRIIALTALSEAYERQKCLDVGCDGLLEKPIERATLLSTVAEHAKTAGPAQNSV